MLKRLIDGLDVWALVPVSGLCLFGWWLIKTSLGRKALVNSKPRRNNMPSGFAWMFLLLWFCVTMLAGFLVEVLTPGALEDRLVLIRTIVQAVVNTAFGIGALILVRNYFARRLKGFGISLKKIPGDALFAFADLYAIWPVVFAVLQATLMVGRWIYSSDYQIERNEELELIAQYAQPSIRTAILISGTIVTPFFEEILFRGLIQSAIRTLVRGPWIAIAVSSAVFALVHPQAHWAGIFVMGMLFGYAYERSGSLLRPMFIHALFNGITIIAAMGQS
jgi:membrane protease YdiL (CAAX protease family)